MALKNYQQAIDDYNKSIELESQHIHTYTNRAIVYMALKNYQQAIDDMKIALSLSAQQGDTNLEAEIRESIRQLELLDFWQDAGSQNWFGVSDEFDRQIRERFSTLHQEALQGQLDWQHSPHGALALVILLDQFSRNIYREQEQAFAADGMAQEITLQAIAQEFDMEVSKEERVWFYMPLMHAENEEHQALSVRYFHERVGDETNIKFAEEHADIIARFGRFPHRNAVLGRQNTPEEEAFLAENPSGWGQ